MNPGKMEKLVTGMSVVYVVAARLLDLKGKPKACGVGKLMNISRVEASVVVHCHRPVNDGHLRIQWKPVFIEEGVQVLGSGSRPMTETVEIRRILFPVQLHDGVLPHTVCPDGWIIWGSASPIQKRKLLLWRGR